VGASTLEKALTCASRNVWSKMELGSLRHEEEWLGRNIRSRHCGERPACRLAVEVEARVDARIGAGLRGGDAAIRMIHDADALEIEAPAERREAGVVVLQAVEDKTDVRDPFVDARRDDLVGNIERWIAGVQRDVSVEIDRSDLVWMVDPDHHEAVAAQVFGQGRVELDVRRVARRENDDGVLRTRTGNVGFGAGGVGHKAQARHFELTDLTARDERI